MSLGEKPEEDLTITGGYQAALSDDESAERTSPAILAHQFTDEDAEEDAQSEQDESEEEENENQPQFIELPFMDPMASEPIESGALNKSLSQYQKDRIGDDRNKIAGRVLITEQSPDSQPQFDQHFKAIDQFIHTIGVLSSPSVLCNIASEQTQTFPGSDSTTTGLDVAGGHAVRLIVSSNPHSRQLHVTDTVWYRKFGFASKPGQDMSLNTSINKFLESPIKTTETSDHFIYEEIADQNFLPSFRTAIISWLHKSQLDKLKQLLTDITRRAHPRTEEKLEQVMEFLPQHIELALILSKSVPYAGASFGTPLPTPEVTVLTTYLETIQTAIATPDSPRRRFRINSNAKQATPSQKLQYIAASIKQARNNSLQKLDTMRQTLVGQYQLVEQNAEALQAALTQLKHATKDAVEVNDELINQCGELIETRSTLNKNFKSSDISIASQEILSHHLTAIADIVGRLQLSTLINKFKTNTNSDALNDEETQKLIQSINALKQYDLPDDFVEIIRREQQEVIQRISNLRASIVRNDIAELQSLIDSLPTHPGDIKQFAHILIAEHAQSQTAELSIDQAQQLLTQTREHMLAKHSYTASFAETQTSAIEAATALKQQASTAGFDEHKNQPPEGEEKQEEEQALTPEECTKTYIAYKAGHVLEATPLILSFMHNQIPAFQASVQTEQKIIDIMQRLLRNENLPVEVLQSIIKTIRDYQSIYQKISNPDDLLTYTAERETALDKLREISSTLEDTLAQIDLAAPQKALGNKLWPNVFKQLCESDWVERLRYFMNNWRIHKTDDTPTAIVANDVELERQLTRYLQLFSYEPGRVPRLKAADLTLKNIKRSITTRSFGFQNELNKNLFFMALEHIHDIVTILLGSSNTIKTTSQETIISSHTQTIPNKSETDSEENPDTTESSPLDKTLSVMTQAPKLQIVSVIIEAYTLFTLLQIALDKKRDHRTQKEAELTNLLKQDIKQFLFELSPETLYTDNITMSASLATHDKKTLFTQAVDLLIERWQRYDPALLGKILDDTIIHLNLTKLKGSREFYQLELYIDNLTTLVSQFALRQEALEANETYLFNLIGKAYNQALLTELPSNTFQQLSETILDKYYDKHAHSRGTIRDQWLSLYLLANMLCSQYQCALETNHGTSYAFSFNTSLNHLESKFTEYRAITKNMRRSQSPCNQYTAAHSFINTLENQTRDPKIKRVYRAMKASLCFSALPIADNPTFLLNTLLCDLTFALTTPLNSQAEVQKKAKRGNEDTSALRHLSGVETIVETNPMLFFLYAIQKFVARADATMQQEAALQILAIMQAHTKTINSISEAHGLTEELSFVLAHLNLQDESKEEDREQLAPAVFSTEATVQSVTNLMTSFFATIRDEEISNKLPLGVIRAGLITFLDTLHSLALTIHAGNLSIFEHYLATLYLQTEQIPVARVMSTLTKKSILGDPFGTIAKALTHIAFTYNNFDALQLLGQVFSSHFEEEKASEANQTVTRRSSEASAPEATIAEIEEKKSTVETAEKIKHCFPAPDEIEVEERVATYFSRDQRHLLIKLLRKAGFHELAEEMKHSLAVATPAIDALWMRLKNVRSQLRQYEPNPEKINANLAELRQQAFATLQACEPQDLAQGNTKGLLEAFIESYNASYYLCMFYCHTIPLGRKLSSLTVHLHDGKLFLKTEMTALDLATCIPDETTEADAKLSASVNGFHTPQQHRHRNSEIEKEESFYIPYPVPVKLYNERRVNHYLTGELKEEFSANNLEQLLAQITRSPQTAQTTQPFVDKLKIIYSSKLLSKQSIVYLCDRLLILTGMLELADSVDDDYQLTNVFEFYLNSIVPIELNACLSREKVPLIEDEPEELAAIQDYIAPALLELPEALQAHITLWLTGLEDQLILLDKGKLNELITTLTIQRESFKNHESSIQNATAELNPANTFRYLLRRYFLFPIIYTLEKEHTQHTQHSGESAFDCFVFSGYDGQTTEISEGPIGYEDGYEPQTRETRSESAIKAAQNMQEMGVTLEEAPENTKAILLETNPKKEWFEALQKRGDEIKNWMEIYLTDANLATKIHAAYKLKDLLSQEERFVSDPGIVDILTEFLVKNNLVGAIDNTNIEMQEFFSEYLPNYSSSEEIKNLVAQSIIQEGGAKPYYNQGRFYISVTVKPSQCRRWKTEVEGANDEGDLTLTLTSTTQSEQQPSPETVPSNRMSLFTRELSPPPKSGDEQNHLRALQDSLKGISADEKRIGEAFIDYLIKYKPNWISPKQIRDDKLNFAIMKFTSSIKKDSVLVRDKKIILVSWHNTSAIAPLLINALKDGRFEIDKFGTAYYLSLLYRSAEGFTGQNPELKAKIQNEWLPEILQSLAIRDTLDSLPAYAHLAQPVQDRLRAFIDYYNDTPLVESQPTRHRSGATEGTNAAILAATAVAAAAPTTQATP